MDKIKDITVCDPINDKVLIRPDPIPTTESGIVFVGNTKQKQDVITSGTVVKTSSEFVDKDGKLIKISLQVGDRLLFGHNVTGLPIEVNGEKLLIISYHEIIGIINQE